MTCQYIPGVSSASELNLGPAVPPMAFCGASPADELVLELATQPVSLSWPLGVPPPPPEFAAFTVQLNEAVPLAPVVSLAVTVALEVPAVVGVPDHKYGEAVCACIRLREGTSATEEEIREFCRGQIAHYKVPRYVRFVDSFPLTISGKVQKYLIREHMRVELHLTEEAHA